MQDELPLDDSDAIDGPIGRRGNVWLGTCSWADPSLIRSKRFYPRGCNSAADRLRYYASQFPIVEIDSSYFALPQAANTALWAERTPPHFAFNIKAFRLFTGHQTPPEALPRDIAAALPPLAGRKKNHYAADLPRELLDELWQRYLDALLPLRDAGKLRAVHLQFAPWVANTRAWRTHVEDCVARLAGHLVAVEFRNATWLDERARAATLAWLRELAAVHVVVDEPQGAGDFAHSVWAVTNPALAVVRLHGRNAATWNAKGLTESSQRFDYDYRDDELDGIAAGIDGLVEQAIAVHALLNVNFEDQGIRAARRLASRLRGVARGA